MVHLAQIIGVAALLSRSVLAAPAMRRSQYQQQQYDNSYNQPAQQYDNKYDSKQENKYENKYEESYSKPSYDDSYKYDTTSVEETSVMETSTPSYEDNYKYEYDTTSVEETSVEETSVYETSTYYEEPPSYTTKSVEETSVWETSSAMYEAPTYGSGQSNWGQSYEDCVSKCVADYGAPPKEWTPSPMPEPEGTGAVHTVMVAPTAGVLRYWPFAVNATVGDTIRYVWSTPANHTATLSSALAICNKSAKAEELDWVSGVRNASAGPQTFDVKITTDEQQFFYCSVAQHCSKGMFGIVQPKNGGSNTVSFHMNEWLESSPDLKAAWAVVHESTKGTTADTWGNNFDISDIPESSHLEFAKNLVWNRAMFAANPGTLEANSAATPDGSPLKLVGDLSTLLSQSNQDPNGAGVPQGTPTGSVPVPSAVASELANAAEKTGAGFKTAAPVWVAAFVGVVSYLVL